MRLESWNMHAKSIGVIDYNSDKDSEGYDPCYEEG